MKDYSGIPIKKFLGWYVFSVIVAALVLMAKRLGTAEGFWDYMDIISLCIWQAVVWPLYALMQLAGAG